MFSNRFASQLAIHAAIFAAVAAVDVNAAFGSGMLVDDLLDIGVAEYLAGAGALNNFGAGFFCGTRRGEQIER